MLRPPADIARRGVRGCIYVSLYCCIHVSARNFILYVSLCCCMYVSSCCCIYVSSCCCRYLFSHCCICVRTLHRQERGASSSPTSSEGGREGEEGGTARETERETDRERDSCDFRESPNSARSSRAHRCTELYHIYVLLLLHVSSYHYVCPHIVHTFESVNLYTYT